MMLLLLNLQSAYGMYCHGYSCSSSSVSMNTSTCISQQGGFFSLATCQDEFFSYCSPNLQDTVCTLPPTTSDINISYPGEPCTFDRNCLTSRCILGFCQGFSVNAPCQVNSQCNPGLFCNLNTVTNIGTCTNLLSANMPCFLDDVYVGDYMCGYAYGCDGQSGTCKQYFSMPAYTPLQTCDDGLNPLCSSGFCNSNSSNGDWQCLDSYPTIGSLPKMCYNDGDCVVGTASEGYSTYCECGKNADYDSYCNLAPGDAASLALLSLSKQWVSSGNASNCHTERRTNMQCLETYANSVFIVNYTYQLMELLYYPYVQENDECIKNIYTSAYWQALAAYNAITPQPTDHSGSLIHTASMLLGLILAF